MDKGKKAGQLSKEVQGQKSKTKKKWKKPQLDELATDQTEGGPVQNPVDGGSRHSS